MSSEDVTCPSQTEGSHGSMITELESRGDLGDGVTGHQTNPSEDYDNHDSESHQTNLSEDYDNHDNESDDGLGGFDTGDFDSQIDPLLQGGSPINLPQPPSQAQATCPSMADVVIPLIATSDPPPLAPSTMPSRFVTVSGFNFPIDEDSSPTAAAQDPSPAPQEDLPATAAAQDPPPATPKDIPTTQPATRRTRAKDDVPAPMTQPPKRARTRKGLPKIQPANGDAATAKPASGKRVQKPTGPREPIALTDRDSAAGGKGSTAKRKLDTKDLW
jgi:hypothetical protein